MGKRSGWGGGSEREKGIEGKERPDDGVGMRGESEW